MTTREKTRSREKALQTRSRPFGTRPLDELERWFDEFDRRGWLHPYQWEWPKFGEAVMPFTAELPKIDVVDREKELLVRAELPGVEKPDLDITVTDHSVTIKAHRKHEEKEEQDEYYHHEMSYGEYQRTLELPETVDGEQAKAKFRNGVLELKLPKMEKTRRKTVKVE